MSQDFRTVESILALDCGSTTTQAMLLDRVGKEYRLVARADSLNIVFIRFERRRTLTHAQGDV